MLLRRLFMVLSSQITMLQMKAASFQKNFIIYYHITGRLNEKQWISYLNNVSISSDMVRSLQVDPDESHERDNVDASHEVKNKRRITVDRKLQ
jgi:hypothetical protein